MGCALLVGSLVAGLAFVLAARVWSWPLQAIAGALQVLGIALAAFGLDVVRTSLQRASDAATAAKEGVARWVAIRWQQLTRQWLRMRGRPVPTIVTLTPAVTVETALPLTARRRLNRVDRDAISDRAWLAYLDDQIANLWQTTWREEEARAANRRDLGERIARDHATLRGEIVHATRQGWELVVAGLIYSAVGTFVGIWA